MTRRTRSKLIAIGVFASFITFAAMALPSLWRRICGNYPITFYGRVVNEHGKGVSGVSLTFAGSYSDRPVIPLPYGLVEKRWVRTVATDVEGNFVLHAVGYSVGGQSAHYSGQRVDIVAAHLKPEDDPAYGVMMNDRFSRLKLPDSPQKRVIYRLVPPK